jgi:SET family sugar efflux transporter-like MFS transporter
MHAAMVTGGRMSAFAKIAAVGRIRGFPALGAAALVLGLAHALTVPYLSLFALTEAHFGPRQLGAYIVLSALSNLPAATWLGRLSDRGRSRRGAMLLALGFAAVGYALMSQLRGFFGLLANSVLLLSLGRASFPQTFSLARARFEAQKVEDITLATNALRMFFSVAWVGGPALGAVLLGVLGFRGLYLAIAVVYAVVAALIAPIDAPASVGPASSGGRAAALLHLRKPALAAATAGFALIFLCSSLNMIVFPLYVVETLHGAKHDVGWLLGLAAGLEIPLMLGSALLSSRFGKGRLIVISALLYALYFAAMALARSPWQLYPIQLLSAVVVSIAMGLGMSYFQDQLPGEPGVSTALYANAMTLGSVLGGLLFALLVGPFGHRGVLVACAACSLVGCGLLAMSRRAGSAAGDTGADRSRAA